MVANFSNMEKRQELPNVALLTQGQENEKIALAYIIWQLCGLLANKDVRKEKPDLGVWLEDGTMVPSKREKQLQSSRKSTRVKMEHRSTSKLRDM